MENQGKKTFIVYSKDLEHDLSIECASTHEATQIQNNNSNYTMPQQNQPPQYNSMPSFYGNNTMNMPAQNSMQQGL